jgi:excisionase family DNA binding protein
MATSARLTYSVDEVGKLLGIGRNQAYDAARRGDFPVLRVGKRLLVPKAAINRMLGLVDDTADPGTTAARRRATTRKASRITGGEAA